MWLKNPDWKVLPKIYFVDGYPRVLTWKYHYGGCNLIYIHCCRWRTNIPSTLCDQFFHNVVKPWTVKHMKVGYNSTGYQMVEQQSSWKCPDTINVSSVENTDNGYILIQESEAHSYANFTDIIDDETFSNDHAELIEEFSLKNQEMLTT